MLRLILVIVFIPALCFGAAPSDVLVKAQRAYQRGKYETTIKLVEPLLYPQLRLSRRKEVLQAHKLLGISHVFVKNNRAAEKEFLTILSMEPNYRFDSFVDPVVAVELFDAVKKRNAEILKRIVEREKKEAELRKQAEARRLAELRQKEADNRPKQKVAYNRYWLNFVPFGAGQFQNGHRTKGYALLGLQAAATASSMTLFTWRLAEGKVPSDQADRARNMEIAQVVCGGVFFAAVLYGVIDAMIYYQPETSLGPLEKTVPPTKSGSLGDASTVQSSWILAPTANAEGGGFVFSLTY
jgi:hypothetical protein